MKSLTKTPRISRRFCAALVPLLLAGAASAQCPDDPGVFELYVLDTKTGEAVRVTNTPGYGLFNASFSNDGKSLVHEAVGFDSATCSYVGQFFAKTDIATGETTIDPGRTANNAVWSPNGNLIAYDDIFLNFPWGLYVMPAEGGDSVLLREWGVSASWSNTGKRLGFADADFVFSYPDWGYIATVDLEGNEVRFDTVGAYGCDLDYSSDGKLIVYSEGDPLTFGGCFGGPAWPLKAIAVNEHGEPLGDSYLITDGQYQDLSPSISNDGKQVVFHSNRSPTGDYPLEFDLWMVPTDGSGQPTKVYGLDGVGEFDPAFSKNGRYIVFSSDRDAVASP